MVECPCEINAISTCAMSTFIFSAFSAKIPLAPVSNNILWLLVSMYRLKPCSYENFSETDVFSTSVFIIIYFPPLLYQSISFFHIHAAKFYKYANYDCEIPHEFLQS